MTVLTRLLRSMLAVAIAYSLATSSILLTAQESKSTGRMREDLKLISSDEYEGRGIGTRGLDMAADFVRKEFAAARLQMTSVGDGAFQKFEVLDKVEQGSPNTLAFLGPEGVRLDAELDVDFRPVSLGGSGEISAGLVFAGYGIESKEPLYDEFEGLDVQGKTVVMLRRTPQQDKKDGLFGGPHSTAGRLAALKTKISNAQRRGAAAVLFVNDFYTGQSALADLKAKLDQAKDDVLTASEPFATERDSDRSAEREKLSSALTQVQRLREQIAADDPDPLITFGSSGTPSTGAIPVFQVKRGLVDKVLSPALGTSLAAIEKQIDETGKPASVVVEGWKADITSNIVVKMAPVKNVIGILPGEGALAEETVIVGAHYDHLGYGDTGTLQTGSKDIHNGADDNASGTVALVELARRLAKMDFSPRRRIVFIAFTGEERGLLGSAEYVKNPVFPLETTVAMINLDMVGRLTDDKLTVFGTDTAKEWSPLIDESASAQKLTIIKKPEGFGPSDHSSFYARQIPVLHLFTGTHSEYHRPNDDWGLINFDGMERIVNFTLPLIQWAAKTKARPTYVQVAGKSQLEHGGGRPYFGSIPDFGTNEKGYALQGVAPGSPAAKGGLKAGDIIVKLGDQAIASLDDFDLALRKYSAGAQVDVVVKRGGMDVTLKVTLERARE